MILDLIPTGGSLKIDGQLVTCKVAPGQTIQAYSFVSGSKNSIKQFDGSVFGVSLENKTSGQNVRVKVKP